MVLSAKLSKRSIVSTPHQLAAPKSGLIVELFFDIRLTVCLIKKTNPHKNNHRAHPLTRNAPH